MKSIYFQYRKYLFKGVPHIMLAAIAIVYYSVLVYPDPGVYAWRQKAVAILAELFFKRRRQLYLVFH